MLSILFLAATFVGPQKAATVSYGDFVECGSEEAAALLKTAHGKTTGG